MLMLMLACTCAPTPPPTDSLPTDETPEAPSLVPTRHTVHDGRFSLMHTGSIPLHPTNGNLVERTTRLNLPTPATLWSVTITESLEPETLLTAEQVQAALSQLTPVDVEVLEEGTLTLPDLGTEGRWVLVERANGKRAHLAAVPLDEKTLALITASDRSEALTTDAFIAHVQQIRTEAPRAEVPIIRVPERPPVPVVRGLLSPDELRYRPQGTAPGQPSLAHSCQVDARQCVETAQAASTKAWFRDAEHCPGSFEPLPCPSENRLGICSLAHGQLVHFYTTPAAPSSVSVAERTCTSTFKGAWLGLPDQRPWPVNP